MIETKNYLKIEVNYQKPAGVKDEKAKDDKSMGQEDSPEKTPQEYAKQIVCMRV